MTRQRMIQGTLWLTLAVSIMIFAACDDSSSAGHLADIDGDVDVAGEIGGPCRTNDDCDEGCYCTEEQVCYCPPPTSCEYSTDCPTGQYCGDEDVCVTFNCDKTDGTSCLSHNDCTQGEICAKEGVCCADPNGVIDNTTCEFDPQITDNPIKFGIVQYKDSAVQDVKVCNLKFRNHHPQRRPRRYSRKRGRKYRQL